MKVPGWTLVGLGIVACLLFPPLIGLLIVAGMVAIAVGVVWANVENERHKRALKAK